MRRSTSGPFWPVLAAAALVAGLTPGAQAQEPREAEAPATLEGGELPASWYVPQSDCGTAHDYRIHAYNATFFILRQSGCTHYEKPFVYLLFGTQQALLFDTGASGAHIERAIDRLMNDKPGMPLVVIHSHGHGDHTFGDTALRLRPNTTVVSATVTAVTQFFGIANWPTGTAQYDLGNRVVDIVPIPGHETAHIALYDRRTGILLTGDTLYPGRLYISDQTAYRASVDRLVAFTQPLQIAHVFGGHIEQSKWPFLDYPIGTQFQPEEHVLELGRAHLLELWDNLHQMTGSIQRKALRDFTIFP
jgi:glyoxylase-like metal-dependent hydrolase (beta-lactamase superfamily II)